jgi:hypothetical protein
MKFAVTMCASVGLVVFAGCTGTIGDDSGRVGSPDDRTPPGTNESPQCTGGSGNEPGRSPIRRLTRLEIDNAVRDLLADNSKPARSFVPEEESLGFDNNADALGMSGLLAEQVMEAAEKIAATAVTKLATIAPACDTAKEGEATCARRFVTTWGKRAWRRALSDAEVNDLVALYTKGAADGGYSAGIALVIQRILQSPFFLYRVEHGDAATLKDGVMQLTGYEQASRLSFLLWSSTPDSPKPKPASSRRPRGSSRSRGECSRIRARRSR